MVLHGFARMAIMHFSYVVALTSELNGGTHAPYTVVHCDEKETESFVCSAKGTRVNKLPVDKSWIDEIQI